MRQVEGHKAAAALRGEAVFRVFIQCKVRNQADKTQRNSGRGAESTKPQNQGNEGGRSKQEESLRQDTLDHCSLYKRPDKLATREKQAWPVNTTGRGTKGTQVRHITSHVHASILN